MNSRAIEYYKKSLRLNQQQREALVGLLLGDACLETQNGGRTYRLKIEQSARHEAYVRHLYALFRPWVLTPPREKECVASNGTRTTSWAFSTVSHTAFRFYAHQFYGGKKKQAPRLLNRWLTPCGLAYWFMDDGSMKSEQSKGVIFNTQGFERPSVDRLLNVLQNQFRLNARIRHQSDGLQIYVSGSSYEDLAALISPFLIDAMRHKLPQARRTRLPKE